MTVAELRALLAKAAPGPWHHAKDGDDFFALFTDDEEYAFGCRDECDEADNAALAAAAVNNLPALLDVADIVVALGSKPAPTNDYPMSTRGRWGCTLCSGMHENEDEIVHDEDCVWLRARAALAKLETP